MIKNREQLDIVLQAIIAARDSTSGTTAFGKTIRLVRQPKTPLWTIKPMDLLRLLQKLEGELQRVSITKNGKNIEKSKS